MVISVGIIDYGCGNLRSVSNAFSYIGVESEVVGNATQISSFSHLVLPGVGSYRKAMQCLIENGFDSALKQRVYDGTPLLGICLGMQLLGLRSSEDGETRGLGFIEADVDKFVKSDHDLYFRVPHVGFNTVYADTTSKLFKGFEKDVDFYFTHSYRMSCVHSHQAVGMSHHGDNFVSAVEHLNIIGTQFHPEKSQQNGLRLLSNFVSLKPC